MSHRAALPALVLLLPLAARAAEERVPGVWWEQTVEMKMMGFSMPAQTMKVCMPKGAWDRPPEPGGDDNCQMTDVKRSGSRFQWKVRCKDGTSGSGDMTFGGDRFQGTTTMNTGGQTVNMAMSGRRLGGDCDANENERQAEEVRAQVEQQQAQQAELQAQGCAEAVDEMQLSALLGPVPGMAPPCKDEQPAFCRRLQTREGLVAFRNNSTQPDARPQAEKLCRVRLADVEAKLCADAAREQSRGRRLEGEAVEFVFASCPAQAQALAKTECAGRSYTSMPEAQRDFCTRYARERLDRGEPASQPAPSVPVPDVKREILRGIFGR
jgi:hypothetical protein